MSVSFVRDTTTTGTTPTLSWEGATPQGRLLVITAQEVAGGDANTAPNVPDASWRVAYRGGPVVAGGGEYLGIFYKVAGSSEPTSYLPSEMNGANQAWLGEFASTVGWGSDPLDRAVFERKIASLVQTAKAGPNSSATQRPHGVAIGTMVGSGTLGSPITHAPSDTWALRQTAPRGATAYRILTAAGQYSVDFSWPTTRFALTGLATFTEASDGGGDGGFRMGVKLPDGVIYGTLKTKSGGVLI